MKKRKTLKWLGIFVAVLLVAMFFSRTVQTITTPKVQKTTATRGKLEEKIPVTAQLTFGEGEEVFIPGARKLNLSITQVLAQQGFYVKEGDLLARAEIPTLEEERQKIQAEYDKAVRALGEQITSQVRLAQDSPHNQLYEHYFDTLQAYYGQRLEVERLAKELRYELPEDMQTWGRAPAADATPAPQARPTPEPPALAQMPAELKGPMQEAFESWLVSETAFDSLRRVYTGNNREVTRVGAATFDHIKKLYELRRALSDQGKAMMELLDSAQGMDEIRAPHTGYLTAFTLKRGDSYDGSKALYTISKEAETPTLRADITDIRKTIEKGTKVQMEGVRQELAVGEVVVEGGGRKYAVVELNENLIGQLGGVRALMDNPPGITLVYKSPRTTTLLPASAVRTDSDGSSFVYAIQQNWGGLLGNMQYILKKQPVTVLEKSSRMVAVSEELSWLEIADREDRAVSDGQVVMEYVD